MSDLRPFRYEVKNTSNVMLVAFPVTASNKSPHNRCGGIACLLVRSVPMYYLANSVKFMHLARASVRQVIVTPFSLVTDLEKKHLIKA